MSTWKRPDTGDFTPCPEGLHDAVCCDIVELRVRDYNDPTKTNDKVRLVFQIEEVNQDHPEQARFTCSTSPLTPSLHERAKLRKLLEGWRGRKLSEKELGGFDSETLIGINGQILVKHQIRDNGDTYANVTEILPPKKDKKTGKQDWKRLEVEGYTRVKDRTPKDEAKGGQTRQRSPMDPDYADGADENDDPWSAGNGSSKDEDDIPF